MNLTKRNYEDILQPRREEFSNYVFMSKKICPKVAYKQVPKPTPNTHKQDVLRSPKIQELITLVSKTENIPRGQLETTIKNVLDEIGYNKDLNVIRWLGIILIKICKKVMTSVYINGDYLLTIKEQMGNCPVVFVPSHRSYGDFMILSYVCYHFDIAIPAIAAGMDFQGMFGIGEILRDTGAFYMRRSYNDDTLYWSTFRQYVYQLVTKGDLPIEFFIEGTRSRTNKSLPPKYGLISMILKAFFFGKVPDILFVPIDIGYDRILEESLFAFELLGIPKPKETTKGFLKSLKILKEKFGNIYVNFDSPISAKEFFENKLDRSVHSTKPLHHQELTNYEKNLIPPLAYKIVRKQQKVSTLSIVSLVSLILNSNLVRNEQLLTLDQLKQQIHWLIPFMESFGAFVLSENLNKSIEDCFIVHQNIIKITDNGKISVTAENVVLGKLNPTKLKAHALSESTMTYSVPFVMLQMYVNPALHHFVDAAFVMIVLARNNGLERDTLFTQFEFLRSVFLIEFMTHGDWIKNEFDFALEKSLEMDLIQKTEGKFFVSGNKQLENIIISNIEHFLLTYFIIFSVVQNVPDVCDEKTILKSTQKLVEDEISKKQRFIHPYCLALDTYVNCLTYLTTVDAAKRSRINGKVLYNINQRKVDDLRKKLEMFIPSYDFLDTINVQINLEHKL